MNTQFTELRMGGRLKQTLTDKNCVKSTVSTRAQRRHKGTREGKLKREKERRMKMGKKITMLRFPCMHFSNLPKFIIPSLLSHTRDPFPASIIPSTKPIPLFMLELRCFLSHWKWLLHRYDVLLLHTSRNNSFFFFFSCFVCSCLQWPKYMSD